VSTPTGADLTGHGSALEEEQGIQIHGVLFADDYIEISFLEEREVSDEVSDLRRRIIKSYLFSERIGGIPGLLGHRQNVRAVRLGTRTRTGREYGGRLAGKAPLSVAEPS